MTLEMKLDNKKRLKISKNNQQTKQTKMSPHTGGGRRTLEGAPHTGGCSGGKKVYSKQFHRACRGVSIRPPGWDGTGNALRGHDVRCRSDLEGQSGSERIAVVVGSVWPDGWRQQQRPFRLLQYHGLQLLHLEFLFSGRGQPHLQGSFPIDGMLAIG